VKPGGDESIAQLKEIFQNQVKSSIGPFAKPKHIIIVQELPQTRSGKIMRRILRKVAEKEILLEDAENEDRIREKLGDTSTLAKREVVKDLIEAYSEQTK
jgi:acetyl-CoA synthetase